jgi:peptidyl-prolyl cis-trans isomerase C
MVAPFSEAAAKLEKGEYTKEPVQTQFGWHVIILDDTRESTPPPFEDVKDRLKMLLANQQLQQHIEELKSSAKIEIKE